ncbi:MAG: tetratricopeptide repeat protein, partial [Bacteroidota bacterium]|nr:tetratricopeptide repeat protein [Bacteroidota bacterium]
EKVVEHLKDLIDMYPSDPHIHKILYLIQFHYFKDIEAALVTMERTVKECPDYPHVYNLLGYAYMDLERWDEAEKTFDRYIQLSPNTANPYDSKGDYFMETKQYEKAYESYKKAVEIDPSFSEISKKKARKARMMLDKSNA